MGVLDRFLLFLYSLAIAVLAIFGVSLGIPSLLKEEMLIQIVKLYQKDFLLHLLVISTSLLLFIISLRLLWVSIRRNKGLEKGIDRETEIGSIRISLSTIEEIAVSTAKKIKGVHELTARVYLNKKEANLRIGLKMVVDGKTPIQSLSEELQETVKDQVELIAGVEVDQVSVFVSQTIKLNQNRLRVS